MVNGGGDDATERGRGRGRDQPPWKKSEPRLWLVYFICLFVCRQQCVTLTSNNSVNGGGGRHRNAPSSSSPYLSVALACCCTARSHRFGVVWGMMVWCVMLWYDMDVMWCDVVLSTQKQLSIVLNGFDYICFDWFVHSMFVQFIQSFIHLVAFPLHSPFL